MAHSNTAEFFDFPFVQRAKKALHKVQAALVLHAKYKATYIELDSLNDKELNDIGISRADIKGIAYNHVYGK